MLFPQRYFRFDIFDRRSVLRNHSFQQAHEVVEYIVIFQTHLSDMVRYMKNILAVVQHLFTNVTLYKLINV